jgi:hypothetical protein
MTGYVPTHIGTSADLAVEPIRALLHKAASTRALRSAWPTTRRAAMQRLLAGRRG